MKRTVEIPKDDQQILAVPAGNLAGLTMENGLVGSVAELVRILGPGAAYYRRGDIEEDVTLKQVIPYTVVRWGSYVYRYMRGLRGQEERLHGHWSIGLGGHIEAQHSAGPGHLWADIQAAAQRELLEEVGLHSGTVEQLRLLGYVNHSRDLVGQVHFGVLFEAVVHTPDVQPQEDCIALPGWVHLSEVLLAAPRYELWSYLAANTVREAVGSVQAAPEAQA